MREAAVRMLRRRYHLGPLVQTASELSRTIDLLANAARSHLPVLLLGTAGSGRDLLAHAIHEASLRAGKPFITFDCRKRAPALLEETLNRVPGAPRPAGDLLASAAGGSVLLQNVQDLPMTAQARLMEFLELPRTAPESPNGVPDVRLITASDSDLHAAMDAGRLRPDLFYRLGVLAVQIPPALGKREDLALVMEFLWELGELESRALPGSAQEHWLLEFRKTHAWNDALRELQQAVLRAVAATGPAARPDSLLFATVRLFRRPRPTLLQHEDIDLLRRTADMAIKQFDTFGGDLYDTIVRQLERRLFQLVLQRCNGVKTRAADALGFSLAVFNRRLRDLGLDTIPLSSSPVPPVSSFSPSDRGSSTLPPAAPAGEPHPGPTAASEATPSNAPPPSSTPLPPLRPQSSLMSH